MMVLIFELTVPPEQMPDYLQESEELRRHLTKIDGFISVERCAGPANSGKFAAIGYFEHVKAVTEWRNLPEYRRAQALGRKRFFNSYRLVMAEAVRDYSHQLRQKAPDDSKQAHGE